MLITRKLEFDAGHRIPNHESQCKNLHGHRYVIEITLKGQLIKTPDAPDCGMVMDFSKVKDLAKTQLIDQWDHAFLVYENDQLVRKLLAQIDQHKTVVLSEIPTAENLAKIAFKTLFAIYHQHYGQSLRLEKICLFETPNCWAEIHYEDIQKELSN